MLLGSAQETVNQEKTGLETSCEKGRLCQAVCSRLCAGELGKPTIDSRQGLQPKLLLMVGAARQLSLRGGLFSSFFFACVKQMWGNSPQTGGGEPSLG